MKTRMIVCGSRTFTNRQLCFDTLDRLLEGKTDVEIISGNADGADKLGEEYASIHALKCTVFVPEWKTFGKRAGIVRNKEMLSYAQEEHPVVVAFWDGKSRGTRNMIEIANKAGAEVYVISQI